MFQCGERLAAVFFVLLALASSRVSAQSADELIEQGRALRTQNRDAEALALFQRAYRMTPSARALAQIASAEKALGRWVDAEEHFAAVLAMNDPYVIENRAPFERELASVRERVGRIELMGGVPGAQVYVNGIERGRFPLQQPLAVEAGSVVVDVRADGYHAFQRTVAVAAGRLAREEVRLVAVSEPEPVGTPRTLGMRPLQVAGVQGDAIAGWILTGLGVVSAVASGAWHADRASALGECAGACGQLEALRFEHDLTLAIAGLGTGIAVGGLASALHLTLSTDAGVDRALPELLAAGALAVGAAGFGVYWAVADGNFQNCLNGVPVGCTNAEDYRRERNAAMFVALAMSGAAASTLITGLLALGIERRGGAAASVSCSPSLGGLVCNGSW